MKPILPIAALAALLLLPTTSEAVTRGKVVKESAYPWMADLLGCGGTLIAPDRVLTAAHCVKPLESFDEIELTLGSSFETGRHVKVRRHARDPRYRDIGPGLMARYDLAARDGHRGCGEKQQCRQGGDGEDRLHTRYGRADRDAVTAT